MNDLRVVIATPLEPELVQLIRDADPRLEVVHRPELTGTPSADWMVSAPTRGDAEQRAYEEYLDSAEALFGVPDQSGRELRRTADANPRLRWVHTIPAGGGQQVKAAGLDGEQLERILFTTSAGVHAQPLAEFALFGVLAGAKHLPRLRAAQAGRAWAGRDPMLLLGELTVAVVGLGSIGRRVAQLLAPLGARVVGVHRHPVEAEGVSRVEPNAALGDVLSEADAVVLCLPGTAETHRLLSGEVLARAKHGLTVVNVGRGSTIDEAALVDALRDGRVGGAVLDVFETEPLPTSSPLWTMENVVISPHTAAISEHEPRLIAELFADNARRLLDGEPLRNRVNTREFY
ncbi:MAG: D-2-hydroxyacid dehydrogenase [Micrococcales bacterium]|nr:D-2-hydroxyacid dehydrogenase [Micrococcales bacterium]